MTIGEIVSIAFLLVLVVLCIRNIWGKKWDKDSGPADFYNADSADNGASDGD